MLTKKIKYTDYNGVEREENFTFNLSKADILEMELSAEGGLDQKLKRIAERLNGPEIMAEFKNIIMKAYCVKSDDGRRLIKSKELSEEFTQTEAYSELLMELLSDSNAAADFMKAIVPKVDQSVPAPPLPGK